MNIVQLATITLNGATVYQWACARDAGLVSNEAGAVADALTDRFGDGFGWNVSPLPYAHATASAGTIATAAGEAIVSGIAPLNPAPTSAVVLTPHQADFCGSALEVGADDEDHPESDYAAARELWEKLNQAAELGGSVVVTIQGEGEKE